MAAVKRAPWSLRAYAGLNVAAAILVALEVGGGESWVRVLWVAAFWNPLCSGSRIIWWLPVAGNALALVVIPVFLNGSCLAIPFSLIGSSSASRPCITAVRV